MTWPFGGEEGGGVWGYREMPRPRSRRAPDLLARFYNFSTEEFLYRRERSRRVCASDDDTTPLLRFRNFPVEKVFYRRAE